MTPILFVSAEEIQQITDAIDAYLATLPSVNDEKIPEPLFPCDKQLLSEHKFTACPKEILQLIFTNLDWKEKVMMLYVSKGWYGLLKSLAPVPIEVEKITMGGTDGGCGSTIYPRAFFHFDELQPPQETSIIAVRISSSLPKRNVIAPPIPARAYDKVKGDYYVSYEPLTEMTGRMNHFRFLSVNPFGVSQSGAHHIRVRGLCKDSYCFSEGTKMVSSNGFKEVQNIKAGDILRAANGKPTTVKFIKTTEVHGLMNIVPLDGFQVTAGHPVYSEDEWYRPDELFLTEKQHVGILYNFYCEPEHFLMVQGDTQQWQFSSLGGYCPRIAQIDPYSDILWGRGWGTPQAERYQWLLGNAKRIPNHLVERETDLFWSSQPSNPYSRLISVEG